MVQGRQETGKVPNCTIIQFNSSSLCVFIFLHCGFSSEAERCEKYGHECVRSRTHFEVVSEASCLTAAPLMETSRPDNLVSYTHCVRAKFYCFCFVF